MSAQRPTEPTYHEVELTPARKAIADRVMRSRTEIPDFLVHGHFDMEPVLALREALKATASPVPTINDVLLKLTATVLTRHPLLNAAFLDGKIRVYEEVNVGFAVATEKGVLVPVVRNADAKPIQDIAKETAEMVRLARDGKLRASLQQGGTFSISNIGPGSVEAFNAIISPPQTAILAFGAVLPRPFVVDGALCVRRTMRATVTVDHRAIDGADAGAFVNDLARTVAEPVVG
jgi:pyruvate dehydrogenase E2 component (dihydrolipoamide acetyltransferase)